MKKLKEAIVLCVITITLLFAMTCISESVNIPVNTQVTIQAATLGQKNAVKKAKEYLNVLAFSKKGLVKQLKYEGFTTKEAKYGVRHCGANWKKQAVKKAKSYLDVMSFSRTGLIKQLRYEGFTKKQAKYAVKKVGY